MKEIAGYEGFYAVDESGAVWSLQQTNSRRKRQLKPYVNTGGYLRVNLYKDGTVTHHYIHRLVANAYLPNPHCYHVVNHISANKSDNSVKNLEWCSQKYNIQESHRLGLQRDKRVTATSIITGERRNFSNLKEAGENLFSRFWALKYKYQKEGACFWIKEWYIEVST